jgi:hypothetical protein
MSPKLGCHCRMYLLKAGRPCSRACACHYLVIRSFERIVQSVLHGLLNLSGIIKKVRRSTSNTLLVVLYSKAGLARLPQRHSSFLEYEVVCLTISMMQSSSQPSRAQTLQV